MPSKTSFFNATLFRKNLTRSWPLWGSVTVLGSLVPLFLILSSISARMDVTTADFATFLYTAAVYFLPSATFLYALLVATFVWSYLHNSRAVGMMHSLAVSRTCLFVTGTLSGLTMLLIPYVVVGALLFMLASALGALPVGGTLITILVVLLENLLFFGMATLCAFVSGSRAAMVLYYLVLNFAAPVLDMLVVSLARNFIFGFHEFFTESSTWLAPLASLLSRVTVLYNGGNEMPTIEGFSCILLYGAVGAAMLAASCILYRFRHSESAGNVVAFPWLRPVFRFAISIVSSLTLGRALYETFWVALNESSQSVCAAVVFLSIGAAVGYYAASMLLEKSLRVFKGSLKRVGVVCAVTAALCLCISLDIFGVEHRIPDSEDIRSVVVTGVLEFTWDENQDSALLDEIRDLHKTIIEDKAHVESLTTDLYFIDREDLRWRTIAFQYTLKNGSTVGRYYYLPLSDARTQEQGTYENKLHALIRDPRLLTASVAMPEDSALIYSYLEYCRGADYHWESTELDKDTFAVIYAALLQDAAEGNFVIDHTDWLDYEKYEENSTLSGSLWYEYRTNDNMYGYDVKYIYLQPTMIHTLRALDSIDISQQQDLSVLTTLP